MSVKCQTVIGVNMADAAAARREARRKRILENSHNRLQLISGKCNEDLPRESPVRAIDPAPIQDVSPPSDHFSGCITLNNGVILPENNLFDLLTNERDIANHDIAAGDAELPDITPFLLQAQEPHVTPQVQASSAWEKLTNYSYDIVLLSVLIQLMCYFSLLSFEETYFFLPVLVYSITKMVWFPSQMNSKLSSVLILLQGMSSYRVQRFIYLTQCIGIISRDISIFLFTTICIQSLVITLNDALIT